MKQARRIGGLIKDMFEQPGLGEQLSRHQAWLIWDKVVGEQIAARARPLKLRRNILEVQVDHPVWMQQLQMLKPQILKKLANQLPGSGITDIYLRQTRSGAGIRPPTLPQVEEPPSWTETELTREELLQIDDELSTIKDENLRNALRKFRIKQKKLDKSRAGGR
jgi:hypothetical protein